MRIAVFADDGVADRRISAVEQVVGVVVEKRAVDDVAGSV